MKCQVFKQRNIAIFAILVLSLSGLSMPQINSQIGNELVFSNEIIDSQHMTFFTTQKNDSVEISDSIILKKNNVEIQAKIFNDNV